MFESNPLNQADDRDDVIVRLLASGIVQYANRVRAGQALPLPYPAPLRRAFDRLSLRCIAAGLPPPGSVMSLLRQSQQPFGSAAWPIRLTLPDVADNEVLLAHGAPTQACMELAVASSDVEAELREQTLLHDVLDRSKSEQRTDSYVAFRRLLIERPAMSSLELQRRLSDPTLAIVSEQLQRAYRPAPPEALLDEVAEVCPECGNLRVPSDTGVRACVEPDCHGGAHNQMRVLPADEGVLWIGRELRRFVAAPGRAELRIAERLERGGLPVQLWPDYDACDLLVHLPSGQTWAVDVKSWSCPHRLARRLDQQPPALPGTASRGFIVIDKTVAGRGRAYVNALTNTCSWLRGHPGVEAVTETAFIRRALRRHKEAAQ